MKIGLIEKHPMHTKTGYWFMGLSEHKDVDKIYTNIGKDDIYKFFPLNKSKLITSKVEEIEKDKSLDFVLYGWNYIRRNGVPN